MELKDGAKNKQNITIVKYTVCKNVGTMYKLEVEAYVLFTPIRGGVALSKMAPTDRAALLLAPKQLYKHFATPAITSGKRECDQ